MKSIKLLIFLFTAGSIISCKNETKEAVAEELKPEFFSFKLNAIVKNDDDFQIFFKETSDTQAPYQEVNSVWVGVKGSESAQDIVFNLPEGVYPTQIRLDFGQKKQAEILINSFSASFKNKSFSAKGESFFNLFTPDENFVKIDKVASKIIPIEQKDGKFDPMLYSVTDLTTELSKLSK